MSVPDIRAHLSSIHVNLFVLGAQKAGTSWLWDALNAKPAIQGARVKECHFFDQDAPFDGNQVAYDGYHALFDSAPPDEASQYYLDATPSYLFEPDVPARIAAYNPDAKLIACLRNPTTRAYSHWIMNVLRGIETEDFRAAMSRDMSGLSAGDALDRRFAYVFRGLYAEQIQRYLTHFPAQHLLCLKHEDLRQNSGHALRQIAAFLQCDAALTPPPRDTFALSYPPLARADHTWLSAYFEQANADLSALLGWDLADWATPPAAGAHSDGTGLDEYLARYLLANRAARDGDWAQVVAHHKVLRDIPGVSVENTLLQLAFLLNHNLATQVYDADSAFAHSRPTSARHARVQIRLLAALRDDAGDDAVGAEMPRVWHALGQWPEDVRLLLAASRLLRDPVEKIATLRQAIDVAPTHLSGYMLLCKALRAARRAQEASEIAARGMALCPGPEATALQRFVV
jgi:hypothetical protein